MALFTGLTTPHKLGGVFGLSCYLVLGHKMKEFAKEASEANKDTPFFMGHGDADQVVKYKWGQQTAEVVRKELGHKVEFKTYRWVSFVSVVRCWLTSYTVVCHIQRHRKKLTTWRSSSRSACLLADHCD